MPLKVTVAWILVKNGQCHCLWLLIPLWLYVTMSLFLEQRDMTKKKGLCGTWPFRGANSSCWYHNDSWTAVPALTSTLRTHTDVFWRRITEEQGPQEWMVSELFHKFMKGVTREHAFFLWDEPFKEREKKRDQVPWTVISGLTFWNHTIHFKYVHEMKKSSR